MYIIRKDNLRGNASRKQAVNFSKVLAQNLMTHPFVRAQNLVTHPPFAPTHPRYTYWPVPKIILLWQKIKEIKLRKYVKTVERTWIIQGYMDHLSRYIILLVFLLSRLISLLSPQQWPAIKNCLGLDEQVQSHAVSTICQGKHFKINKSFYPT